ncbi:Uncharacterised protein [Vibrio cholerae]|nr:Uncharacterised protein [Vibrio cholerae]
MCTLRCHNVVKQQAQNGHKSQKSLLSPTR